jgi:hypothetical protein
MLDLNYNNHNLFLDDKKYSSNHYYCAKCKYHFYNPSKISQTDSEIWAVEFGGKNSNGIMLPELNTLTCEEIIIKKLLE